MFLKDLKNIFVEYSLSFYTKFKQKFFKSDLHTLQIHFKLKSFLKCVQNFIIICLKKLKFINKENIENIFPKI